jgi:hypothetical protein
MSEQIKQDIERIKHSADRIAGHAASKVHDAFATSVNLVADSLEKLEKAIDKDRAKQEVPK